MTRFILGGSEAMVSAGRHPKAPVAVALRALGDGFEVTEVHRGHRWGEVRCVVCQARFAVWATPRDADVHGQQVRRFGRRHEHGQEEGDD